MNVTIKGLEGKLIFKRDGELHFKPNGGKAEYIGEHSKAIVSSFIEAKGVNASGIGRESVVKNWLEKVNKI